MADTPNYEFPSIPPETRKIIEAIIEAETGGRADGGYTNDPRDAGGRTIWGISERANPDLWAKGPPSREVAVARYYDRYVRGPGFDAILDPQLQAQVVDFGVTSGVGLATQKLQACVGAIPDGKMGPETLGRVNAAHPALLNNKLALERIKMIGRLVQKRPSDLKFLSGWLNRAISFIRGA